MKKSYSYHDCYLILGLSSNCSWAELRKTYKKLIQKWHPDRYEYGTEEKNQANDKIKSINFAYKQIQKYYNENNNTLPSFEPISATKKTTDSNDATKQTNKPTQSTTETNTVTSEANKKNQTSLKPKSTYQQDTPKTFTRTRRIGFTIAIILASIYYLYFDNLTLKNSESNLNHSTQQTRNPASFLDPIKQTSEPINYFDNNLQQKQNHVQTQTENNESDLAEETFFTSGSSISDVINIQGVPSKTENDIWYYGDSEVHFKNGEVTHWIRSTQTPLKARLIFNKPDTLKTNKLHHQ